MKRIFTLLLLIVTSWQASAMKEINLSFKSAAYTLYGTLTLPDGPGPFPVAVYMHGSGPSDRDETIVMNDGTSQCLYPSLYGNTITGFKDIAAAFAAHGIASFRYDKRTYTYGASLDVKTISPYDMIQDAHSAIDFVKTRTEIDKNRIFLLGHSEGGNFVAVAAQGRTDIKAIVALAPPAHAIDTIIAGQFRYIYRHCADSATGEAVAADVLRVFGRVRQNTWPADTPILGTYPKYWKEWIGIVDSAVIHYQKLQLPVLFLQGTHDMNVPPDNIALFERRVNRPGNSFYLINSLIHYLVFENNPKVPTLVTDTIIQWLWHQGLSSVGEQAIVKPGMKLYYLEDGVEISFRDMGATEMLTVEVLDMSGRKLRHYQVNPQEKLRFSRGEATPGLYLIRATNDKVSVTTRVMIR